MFGLFAFRCDICGNIFRRNKYRWSIRGKKVWVCPPCNSKLERQKSKQAFDPDAELNLPDVRGRSSGCGGCLALIIGGIIISAVVLPMAHNGTKTSSNDIAATPAGSTPSGTAPAPLARAPAQKFASAAEAQKEAVRRYPDLGVSGSKLNTDFVARYKLYQQQRPDYFRDSSWPLRLAEELTQTPQPK